MIGTSGYDGTLARTQRRAQLLAALAAVACLPLFWKLVKLQLVEHDRLMSRAENQHYTVVEVSPRRSDLLDRNGKPLAVGVEVPSLYVDPAQVSEPEVFAARVARATGLREADVLERVREGGRFRWLLRHGDYRRLPEWEDLVARKEFKGLGVVRENGRRYPNGPLAAQALGFTGVDGGLEGLELALNGMLQGEPRRITVFRDAAGRWIIEDPRDLDPVLPPVRLTLDTSLQAIAEEELALQVARSKVRFGCAILMDPHSGDILAIANAPGFDPNRPGAGTALEKRNWAVAEMLEPGSTFKVITAAALLEGNLADPDERVDCGNGAIRVGGITIKDHDPYTVLSFTDVIAKSSNVGAIRLGQRLTPEAQYRMIRAFGFGTSTGSGLPGEAAGLVRPVGNWSRVSGASISMGQEVAVTPLQMLRAVAAVGNGGRLVTPRVLLDEPPVPARQIMRPENARILTRMLSQVTLPGGTGTKAAVAGFEVAGKTGTAQKIGASGGYDGQHTASFVGFVPAADPVLAMIVVMDEPHGPYYGGEIAAPVYGAIARRALPLLGLVPEERHLVVERTPPMLRANTQWVRAAGVP